MLEAGWDVWDRFKLVPHPHSATLTCLLITIIQYSPQDRLALEVPTMSATVNPFNLRKQLAFYGAYHTNPVNVGIHILGVPSIIL